MNDDHKHFFKLLKSMWILASPTYVFQCRECDGLSFATSRWFWTGDPK